MLSFKTSILQRKEGKKPFWVQTLSIYLSTYPKLYFSKRHSGGIAFLVFLKQHNKTKTIIIYVKCHNGYVNCSYVCLPFYMQIKFHAVVKRYFSLLVNELG